MKITTLLLTLATAGFLYNGGAQSAEIKVINTNDSDTGSLRQAIADALPGDTITFDQSLAGQVIVLTSGELVIDKVLTIQGLGADKLKISGNNASRVFNVAAPFNSTVNLSGLYITQGNADSGGGILQTAVSGPNGMVFGTLNLLECEISGNTASDTGGGLAVGRTTIQNCTIAENSASGGGGGIRIGDGTLVNTTISGNNAGFGGGICTFVGFIKLDHCTVVKNSATFDMGGIYYAMPSALALYSTNSIFAQNSSPDPYPDLGAIWSGGHNLFGTPPVFTGDTWNPTDLFGTYAAPLDARILPLGYYGGPTRTHALLPDSPALNAINDGSSTVPTDQRGVSRPQGAGFDIGAHEVTYLEVENADDSGPGSLRQTIADAGAGDLITFDPSMTGQTIRLTSGELAINKSLTIQGPGANRLAVSANAASRVFHVSLADATVGLSDLLVSGGAIFEGRQGAGIFFEGSGTLNLVRCEITGNQGDSGGGLGAWGNGKASTFLNLTDCSIVENVATMSGSGLELIACTVKMRNCTVSRNRCESLIASFGGGIAADGANLDLQGCTIAWNKVSNASGDPTSGGGIRLTRSELNLRNTIVAGNEATFEPDIAGSVTSLGHNLIGRMSSFATAAGDQIGTLAAPLDPKLGPLQDNGGPTRTLALLLGSPAIDAGISTDIPTDQRGVARPQGTALDIGAFELQKTVPIVLCQEEPGFLNCAPAAGGILTEEVVVSDPDLGQQLTVTLLVDDLPQGTVTRNTPINGLVAFDSVRLSQGDHTLKIVVSDGYSEATCESTVTVNPDTVPPVFTSVPLDITVQAADSNGAVVTYAPAAANDLCAGPVPIVYSRASANIFPVGTTTVLCTATDTAGNEATASFTVTVTPKVTPVYSWSDVLQPINRDGSSIFKAGSTLPVKFQLTGANATKTDLVAQFSYVKLDESVTGGVNEIVSTSVATSGNLFRYDGGQYIYNWSTKGLTPGCYQLQIDLGDSVTHTVKVALK
jgi:hypothetical protein